MADDPFVRLPDPVTVPLVEISAVVVTLQDTADALAVDGLYARSQVLNDVIGRISAWVWDPRWELDDDTE